MRTNPFRFLLVLALVLPACLEQAQGLGLVKNVPPPIERGAPDTREASFDLCCLQTDPNVCVQPRLEQDVCDADMIEVKCASARLDVVGPLLECI
jgi:hypothetical protein